jgi:IS30 family transposase
LIIATYTKSKKGSTNGLVRQYFPKGSDFSKITEADIQQVTARLNNRPRKRLNYRTPQRVFFKNRKLHLQVESKKYIIKNSSQIRF